MYDDLSGQADLAPDLEWLLSSTQAEPVYILAHLVEEYGSKLGIIMQTLFADPSIANSALIETLVQIVLQRSRFRTTQPLNVWVVSIALDTAWRVRRNWYIGEIGDKKNRIDNPGALARTLYLPEWLVNLDERSRIAVILQRYFGLKAEDIAVILGTSSSLITSNLDILDKAFPGIVLEKSLYLNANEQKRLIGQAQRNLIFKKPHERFHRAVLEMGWAVGALLLVLLLTWIYDIRNPDIMSKPVEISFLTPLPTSTKEPLPSATPDPWLNINSTSEEILTRYFLRWEYIDSLWVDYLIILGGAQGGTKGYSLSRVEIAYDSLSEQLIVLVGPPGEMPEYGMYVNYKRDEVVELIIDNGKLIETSLDLSNPKHWLYLATVALELPFYGNGENPTFVPKGFGSLAGRDTLLVYVSNPVGSAGLKIWLDTMTAVPLALMLDITDGERSYRVSTIMANKSSISEPIPSERFDISLSEPVYFRNQKGPWIENEVIAENLPTWLDQYSKESAINEKENLYPPLYYEVNSTSQEFRYFTKVFSGNESIGEYPMGNPWSVVCERSPDGNKVAYIENWRYVSGEAVPGKVLHWFSIDRPNELNTPLPDVDTNVFSFSPDSEYLGVHASGEVSLVDLSNDKVDKLLAVPSVDRLEFSKDGRYLGLLDGTTQPDSITNIWIINLENKLVVDEIRLGPDFDWVSNRESIFTTWQVDFDDAVLLGLENCR